MNAPNDPAVVFWQRFERGDPDACWPWTGGVSRAGYGTLWVRGKLKRATHFALELHGKPRPGRSLALHSCDNPPCVNPAHLRWGNHQDNSNDKVLRGRSTKGKTVPSSLRRNKVLIAAILASNDSAATLSRRLGVSKPTVLAIRADHGIRRRVGAPSVMMDRVWAYMATLAPIGHPFRARQTDIAIALGLASSNVNIAIKLLVRDRRMERVEKIGSVWSYRLLS